MMPISRRLFSIAIFLGLAIGSAAGAETLGKMIPVQVISITDGDTIVIRLQGHEEKVRLIGIDAPECRPNPKTEKDAFRTGADLQTITEMGQRATRYVKGMIRPGDRVNIELDV